VKTITLQRNNMNFQKLAKPEINRGGDVLKKDVQDIIDILVDKSIEGPQELVKYIIELYKKPSSSLAVEVANTINTGLKLKKHHKHYSNMLKITQEFIKNPENKKYLIVESMDSYFPWAKPIPKKRVDANLIRRRVDNIVKQLKRARVKDELKKEYEYLKTFLVANELRDINSIRVMKAGINNGMSIVKTAGQVAIMMKMDQKIILIINDVTKKAGLAIKVLDKVNEYGNDYANKEDSAEIIKKLFNKDYSKEQKTIRANESANYILDRVSRILRKGKEFNEKWFVQYKKTTKDFIEAAGMSFDKFKKEPDIKKRKSELIKEMLRT
jgi:hypothetical protein